MVLLLPEICRADSATGLAGLGTLALFALYVILGIPALIAGFFLFRASLRRARRAQTGKELLGSELRGFVAWLLSGFFGLFTYFILGDLGMYSMTGSKSAIPPIALACLVLALLDAGLLFFGRKFLRVQPRSFTVGLLGYLHLIIGIIMLLFVLFLVFSLIISPPQ